MIQETQSEDGLINFSWFICDFFPSLWERLGEGA
jgi:hypothetical protein